MASRSLNKVLLIGNLTRDPEMRYTPQGTAVCTFGMATNRTWVTDNGEKREETEWHRIVAWNKLAELCSQLLHKGRRVYVEGRLQTRQWTGQDGQQRTATEIVIEDMLLLDSRPSGYEAQQPEVANEPAVAEEVVTAPGSVEAAVAAPVARGRKKVVKSEEATPEKSDVAEDIPF